MLLRFIYEKRRKSSSKLQIQEAQANDFDKIYELLKTLDKNPKRHKWLKLFSYKQLSSKSYGFVMINEDKKIVGFLGTIYSQRMIQEKIITLCNITSWVVEEAYRNQSLRLLYKALSDKNCLYTNLSASFTVKSILQQLKFTIIEEYGIIFVPVVSFFALNFSLKFQDNVEIIKNLINPLELKLLQDHKHQNLLVFHIKNKTSYCLILAKRVKKKSLAFIHIYYVSNPNFFGKYFLSKANKILWKYKAIAFLIDERLLQEESLFNTLRIRIKLPATRLAKFPKDLSHFKLRDNLYSELTLLGL